MTAPTVMGPAGASGSWPSPTKLDRLTAVVAVGSNASPAVLREKLADLLDGGVPLAPAAVEGLGVGHSSHVSAGGYIAAAPFRDDDARSAVSVCWLDGEQLAALDATEPNYSRRRVAAGARCTLADGTLVPDAEVYDSRHGVLGDAGRPLSLGTQADVLTWLCDRLPEASQYGLTGTVSDHDVLLDGDVREKVRRAVLSHNLVRLSELA
ncbi:hypothetical protein GCM10023169_33270 [Georgenia halophila]|uniref:Uncharacterized protein n=1 Tax=Georgenia halophila TaxID=620889 RepID=A0ABP8LI54_9MICO